ncbi:hypothetical protein [Dielma fastidiosa]|uniref:hypothetical protein n=1 Tax=Dielma fastidiosa TaxID=1034346 RepID=UPI0035658584
MKILMKKVAIASIALLMCGFMPASAKATDYSIHEQLIESFISTLDETEVSASFVKELYDINGNRSFALFTTSNDGYAVLAIENMAISEISEGNIYDMYNIDEVEYYIGLRGFMTSDEYNQFISQTYSDETQNVYIDIVNATDSILSDENHYANPNAKGEPVLDKPITGTEIGVRATSAVIKSFTKSEWKNTDKNFGDLMTPFLGVCGSISSSMLMTYYDNAIEDILDSPYAYTNSKYPYWIVSQVVPYIDGIFPGANMVEVANGINDFLYDNSSTSLSATVSNKTQAGLDSLDNKKPCVIYVTGTHGFGNPYGLHYVLGFSYVDNGDELWFHVADNWGNLAWVDIRWSSGFIYLN